MLGRAGWNMHGFSLNGEHSTDIVFHQWIPTYMVVHKSSSARRILCWQSPAPWEWKINKWINDSNSVPVVWICGHYVQWIMRSVLTVLLLPHYEYSRNLQTVAVWKHLKSYQRLQTFDFHRFYTKHTFSDDIFSSFCWIHLCLRCNYGYNHKPSCIPLYMFSFNILYQ